MSFKRSVLKSHTGRRATHKSLPFQEEQSLAEGLQEASWGMQATASQCETRVAEDETQGHRFGHTPVQVAQARLPISIPSRS